MEDWVDNLKYLLPSSGIPTIQPEDTKYARMSKYILEKSEADNADIAIVGVPYDSSDPPNWLETCKTGPSVIRSRLGKLRTFSPELGVDFTKLVKIVDMGDLEVVYDTVEVLDRLKNVVSVLVQQNKIPLILGGQHIVSYGAIKGLCKQTKGNVGVIYYDAHLDLDDEMYKLKWYNGAPFRRVLEIGNVMPENLVCIGPRGYIDFPENGWDYAKKMGVHVFTMEDIDKLGIIEVTKRAIECAKRKTDKLYMSVDIDALDAVYTPCTGFMSPGGLTYRELIRSVRLVISAGVDGYDITEVSSQNDPAGITAITAAGLVVEFIGATAKFIHQETSN